MGTDPNSLGAAIIRSVAIIRDFTVHRDLSNVFITNTVFSHSYILIISENPQGFILIVNNLKQI